MTVPTIIGPLRDCDLPVIDQLDQVVRLVEHESAIYIRYSEGPDRDRDGPSRDYESGLVLPGLSVTPLNPPAWWTQPAYQWVARRICKYAELMLAPRRPRPWLLTGREVGVGPDHEPLLAECRPVAWVGPSALAGAARVYQHQFTVGRDARSLPPRPRPAGPESEHAHPADTRCPFCFPAAIAPAQILVTTEHFHLLALAGQIVEGFLGIMTHVCRDGPTRLRCIDDVPMPWAAELDALRDVIVRFYRDVYAAPALFYEHGRGGGGRSSLPGGDFVFHPHLCALPGDLNVHDALRARFSYQRPVRFPAVRTVIGQRPYVYVFTPDAAANPEPTAYFTTSSRDNIEDLSLKGVLIEMNAIDAGADWRDHPGERKLVTVVERFNSWYARSFRRPGDPGIG